MNSIASSNCLPAVIAIFITVTAVMSQIIMSPPAKIAGHNTNSLITHRKDVVARIAYSSTTATASPSLHFSLASDKSSSDGVNHAPKNDGNHDNVPVVSETVVKTEWYYLTFLVLNILSLCLMVINAFVFSLSKSNEHSGYLAHFMLGVALSHFVALFTEINRQETDADFKLTVISKVLIIINTHGFQLAANIDLYKTLKSMEKRSMENGSMENGSMENKSKFQEKISERTAFHKILCWFFQVISIAYCCIDIFHQVDLKILGVLQIHIKPNILTELTPGFVNILFYMYLFKHKEISSSSIDRELLSIYKKRIATRNLMFKLSLLMFTVDFLYILDIEKKWNCNAIHILHLLKSAQGLFILIVIFFGPFAPVLYNALLKRLGLQIIKTENEEETDKPIGII